MLIPQLTNPGEVRDEALLAFALLHFQGAGIFPQGRLVSPGKTSSVVVGKLAQNAARRIPAGWCPQPSPGCHTRALTGTSAILPLNGARGRREDFPRRRFDEVSAASAQGVERASLAMRHCRAGRLCNGALHRSMPLARELAAADAGGLSEHHSPGRAAIGILKCMD